MDTPAFEAGKAHFAFLVLKEHPYGREMLKQLLAAGAPTEQSTAPMRVHWLG